MPKFFVEENQLNKEENIITIIGSDVNHIANVLRLKVNDVIEIGVKLESPVSYKAKIKNITLENIICSIIEESNISKESNISITVFQGIPKADKMELIIQKCTELGVDSFVPLELKRCVSKIEGKDTMKKIARWQKIAEVAAKQSGRDKIPNVREKVNIKNLANEIAEYDCVLVAYEQEEEHSLKELLRQNIGAKRIAIVIGTEGGLEKDEVEILQEAGAKIISLGNRILRTETAPIALTSIIMYEVGDMGGKLYE